MCEEYQMKTTIRDALWFYCIKHDVFRICNEERGCCCTPATALDCWDDDEIPDVSNCFLCVPAKRPSEEE